MEFEKIRGYSALNPQRQAVVRAVIGGQALTPACKLVGLNAGRERKNADLQAVLFRARMAIAKAEPITEGAAPVAQAIGQQITVPAKLEAGMSAQMQAAFYECSRRIHRDRGDACEFEDPAFANTVIVDGATGSRYVPDAEVNYAA